MLDISKLSYRKQVQLLKQLAVGALARYPITIKDISFINHGENATFRVTDSNDCKYLLRVCRNDYHTKEALLEELSWLRSLSKTKKFQLPTPVLSESKRLLENVSTTEIPEGRKVALFHWTEGRFLKKQISENQMTALGVLIAKLHAESVHSKVVHRRYWDAEGLLGKDAKFGSIDNLDGATRDQQRIVTRARKALLKKFKAFETRYPEKMGIIHADLHTGNFLFNNNGIAAIDFDDCGFGFFGYDVAIPIMSLDRFKNLGRKKKTLLKEALFSGYRQIRPWTKEDEAMVDHFILARRLLMLGWVNSRSDNPELKKYFKGALKRTINHLLK